MPKDFVSVADFSADDLWSMADRAAHLRAAHREGKHERTLEGRTLAMYFEKPSLRTHVLADPGLLANGLVRGFTHSSGRSRTKCTFAPGGHPLACVGSSAATHWLR